VVFFFPSSKHATYYPLANPKTKPAETIDANGIPIFDNVPEREASILLEMCLLGLIHINPARFVCVQDQASSPEPGMLDAE
jgi:hypothetical protein